MHYVTDGAHRDRSAQMLHKFAAHMCRQLWEPTRRRALTPYKSLQISYQPSPIFTPTSLKNQSWIWSLRVWVTGTKADEAPAYELRRHPKDRMLIKELRPWRPHKETRCCLLISLIHNYRNKWIYHQRNHIFGWKTDAGICVLPNNTAKPAKISKPKKTSRAFFHVSSLHVSVFPSVAFLPGHSCGPNASGAVACEVSDLSDLSLLADPHCWNMTWI